MNPDLFQFQEYKSRNPDFSKAFFHAVGLQEAETKYK